MSHTPGPWHKARGRAFGLYDIRVAIPGSQDITGHPIAKAVSEEDADLIAAAPELLEALKRARDGLSFDGQRYLAAIDAAIAKADGRS